LKIFELFVLQVGDWRAIQILRCKPVAWHISRQPRKLRQAALEAALSFTIFRPLCIQYAMKTQLFW